MIDKCLFCSKYNMKKDLCEWRLKNKGCDYTLQTDKPFRGKRGKRDDVVKDLTGKITK